MIDTTNDPLADELTKRIDPMAQMIYGSKQGPSAFGIGALPFRMPNSGGGVPRVSAGAGMAGAIPGLAQDAAPMLKDDAKLDPATLPADPLIQKDPDGVDYSQGVISGSMKGAAMGAPAGSVRLPPDRMSQIIQMAIQQAQRRR